MTDLSSSLSGASSSTSSSGSSSSRRSFITTSNSSSSSASSASESASSTSSSSASGSSSSSSFSSARDSSHLGPPSEVPEIDDDGSKMSSSVATSLMSWTVKEPIYSHSSSHHREPESSITARARALKAQEPIFLFAPSSRSGTTSSASSSGSGSSSAAGSKSSKGGSGSSSSSGGSSSSSGSSSATASKESSSTAKKSSEKSSSKQTSSSSSSSATSSSSPVTSSTDQKKSTSEKSKRKSTSRKSIDDSSGAAGANMKKSVSNITTVTEPGLHAEGEAPAPGTLNMAQPQVILSGSESAQDSSSFAASSKEQNYGTNYAGSRTSAAQRRELKVQRALEQTRRALDAGARMHAVGAEMTAKKKALAEAKRVADDELVRRSQLERIARRKGLGTRVDLLTSHDDVHSKAERDAFLAGMFSQGMEMLERRKERIANARPQRDYQKELEEMLHQSMASYAALQKKGLYRPEMSVEKYAEEDAALPPDVPRASDISKMTTAFERLHSLGKLSLARNKLRAERKEKEEVELSEKVETTIRTALKSYKDDFGGRDFLDNDPTWAMKAHGNYANILRQRDHEREHEADKDFFHFHAPQVALQVKYEKLANNGEWDPETAWLGLYKDYKRRQAKKANLLKQSELAQKVMLRSLTQLVQKQRQERRAFLGMDRPPRAPQEVSAMLYAEFFARKKNKQLLLKDSIERERARIQEMRKCIFVRMEKNYHRAVKLYRGQLVENHNRSSGAGLAPMMKAIYSTNDGGGSSSSALDQNEELQEMQHDLPRLQMRKHLFASVFDYLHSTKRVLAVAADPHPDRRTASLKPSNIFTKLHNDAVERLARRQQVRIARALLETRQFKLREWERNEYARQTYKLLSGAGAEEDNATNKSGPREGEKTQENKDSIPDSFLMRQEFEIVWRKFNRTRDRAYAAAKIVTEEREAAQAREIELEQRKAQLARLQAESPHPPAVYDPAENAEKVKQEQVVPAPSVVVQGNRPSAGKTSGVLKGTGEIRSAPSVSAGTKQLKTRK
ncbi:unnamed protein product [Amoebophrya sp. A120]|nr:unnamed protein product [Amoebophrya sp. A120]|eukprot:GSA120T00017822001.1